MMTEIISFVVNRAKEASTWAGISAATIGLAILMSVDWLIIAAIAAGGIALILKEVKD